MARLMIRRQFRQRQIRERVGFTFRREPIYAAESTSHPLFIRSRLMAAPWLALQLSLGFRVKNEEPIEKILGVPGLLYLKVLLAFSCASFNKVHFSPLLGKNNWILQVLLRISVKAKVGWVGVRISCGGFLLF